MQNRRHNLKLSPVNWVIILAALLKFALHMINARGYGLFFDELYTIALSRHLAFGYVDLPPLVPALVALNRALLGESLLAMHIVPALAGSVTLVFVCLIVKEFGGKTFAVALSALAFIVVPIWLTSIRHSPTTALTSWSWPASFIRSSGFYGAETGSSGSSWA